MKKTFIIFSSFLISLVVVFGIYLGMAIGLFPNGLIVRNNYISLRFSLPHWGETYYNWEFPSFRYLCTCGDLHKGTCYPCSDNIKSTRIKTQIEWMALLGNRREEFLTLAQAFLGQADFRKIQYQRVKNETTCDDDNFSSCAAYGVGQSFDFYKDATMLPANNKFAQFMLKYKIMFLEKDSLYKGNSVVFSSGDFGRCGLKYFENNTTFHADQDYLVVTKIDDHWYYFCQDWN